MANQITSHTVLAGCRQDFKAAAGRAAGAADELSGGLYKTLGGIALAERGPVIRRLLNAVEDALADAQGCAAALAGEKKKPKAGSILYAPSRPAAGKLAVSPEDIPARAETIRKAAREFEDISARVSACRRELENLKITEQLVSSLTVIDAMYPLGGVTKAALIAIVRDRGVKALKQAGLDLAKLAGYFEDLPPRLTASAQRFGGVEEKVRKEFFDDGIQRTQQYNKDHKPQKEVKQSISDLERLQAEYTAVYGTASPEIAAEIARLKKLLIAEVSVPLKGQKQWYTCGSASMSMILASLGVNVSEEEIYAFAGKNGNPATGVERLTYVINYFLERAGKRKAYRQAHTYGYSMQQYIDTIKKSLEAGYPVQALIASRTNKSILGYTTKGHYFVITAIYQDEKGVWRVKINDPFSKTAASGKRPSPTTHDMTVEQLRKLNNAHSSNLIVGG